MINAAIAGLGWWGQNLVNAVRASDSIRITTAHTRHEATAAAFCKDAGLRWVGDFDAILADQSIDAVVLATPHSLHADQVRRAAAAQAFPPRVSVNVVRVFGMSQTVCTLTA